jgi:hypothetical protein
MNRRMRNRKSGGVGGRRGKPRLLPDPFFIFPAIKLRKGEAWWWCFPELSKSGWLKWG